MVGITRLGNDDFLTVEKGKFHLCIYIYSLGLCWVVAGLPPWLDTHVFMYMIQYHHVSSEQLVTTASS